MYPDLQPSSVFNDKDKTNKNIDTWDILVDVARTLTTSKYKDDFRMRGMFVLRSFLRDKIDPSLLRGTTDIDSDFRDRQKWESLVSELESLLNNNTQISAIYSIVKRRGFDKNPNSDSIAIRVIVEDIINERIKLDINIRSWKEDQEYIIPEITFEANTFYAMLCDKISVLTQPRLQRRIKDLYDVYLIQKSVDVDMSTLVKTWNQEERILGKPIALIDVNILHNLKHAYNVYDGFNPSLDFDEVYVRVIDFTTQLFQILYGYDTNSEAKWDSKKGVWINGLA